MLTLRVDGCKRDVRELLLVTHPSTMQVAGGFLIDVGKGDFTSAGQRLDFKLISSKFHKLGVAPNLTDAAAAAWMTNLCFQPLVKFLRGDKAGLQGAVVFVSRIVEVIRQHFMANQLLEDIVKKYDSVKILLVATSGTEGTSRSSAVRRALQDSETWDPKAAESLALQHGELGKIVRDTCAKLVAANARDDLAREKLANGKAMLTRMLQGGADADSFAALTEIAAGVQMVHASSVEDMLPELDDILRQANSVAEMLQKGLHEEFTLPLVEMAREGIDIVDAAAACNLESDKTSLSQQSAVKEEASQQSAVKEETGQSEPKSPNIVPAYFTAEFLDKFIPMVRKQAWRIKVESDVLVEFLAAASKTIDAMLASLKQAGVSDPTLPQVGPGASEVELCVRMYTNTLDMFEGFACFSAASHQKHFREIFCEWSGWKDPSLVKVKAESAETVAPSPSAAPPPPFLHLFLRGARAATSILLDAEHFGKIESDQNFGQLIVRLVSSHASTMYTDGCSSLLADALLEVRAISFSESFMLQDSDMLASCTSLQECSKSAQLLLSSAWRLSMDETVVALTEAAAAAFDTHPTGLPACHTWPHQAATDLAKECVNLLAADDDATVARGKRAQL